MKRSKHFEDWIFNLPYSRPGQHEYRWGTTTQGARCAIWLRKNTKFKYAWTGQCDKEGRVHGKGDLIYLTNGYYDNARFPVTGDNGSIAKNGKFFTTDALDKVTYSVYRCETYSQGVKANVPRNITLANTYVVNELARRASAFLFEHCFEKSKWHPIGWFPNYEVRLGNGVSMGYHSKDYVEKLILELKDRGYVNNKPLKAVWDAARDRYRKSKLLAKTIREQKQKEKLRVEKERKQREEQQRKVASRELLDNFVKVNKVEFWPGPNKLQANPFLYEGEIVALRTVFNTMIAKNKAVFGTGGDALLVSSVPRGRFNRAVRVVLAGRVLGKDLIKVPLLGEILVPHLKFVDAHDCANRTCDEMFYWQR